MTTTTRATRRRPMRRPTDRRHRSPWLLRITVAAIVLAALAAATITLLGGDGAAETTAFDTSRTAVDGEALVPLPSSGSDPAVGQAAPLVEGRDLDGDTVSAPSTGRPTVLVFLAHWCPHCQREVPAIQGWVDAGEMPSGVDVVAVSTAVDPSRPNYPPSAWLDREHWGLPTVADAAGTAATAYGVAGFPFWVGVDADGVVVERRAGELTLDQLRDLTATAAM